MNLRVPPLVWVLLAGALMWLVDAGFPGLRFETPKLRVILIPLWLAGTALIATAIIQFARLKTTANPLEPEKSTSLSTNGIYQFTRNPMYLGMAVLLLSWVIFLGNPLNLVSLAGFVFVITRWQIKPEEAALRGLFGEEYETYCRNVRRWI